MAEKWSRRCVKRKYDDDNDDNFKLSALGLELLSLFAAGESDIQSNLAFNTLLYVFVLNCNVFSVCKLIVCSELLRDPQSRN
jgi:hypothetical protein